MNYLNSFLHYYLVLDQFLTQKFLFVRFGDLYLKFTLSLSSLIDNVLMQLKQLTEPTKFYVLNKFLNGTNIELTDTKDMSINQIFRPNVVLGYLEIAH